MSTLAPLETLYEVDRGAELPLPPALATLYGPLRFPAHPERPHVIGNFVMTLDGVVALNVPGRSGGGEISGFNQHDRMVMGLLRAASDAVIVGAGMLRAVPRHRWTAAYVCPALADAYQTLRAELGDRADALLAERVNATDGVELARFIDGAVAALGRLDALVNVIGGYAGGRPLHETDEATWDHMMELNLRAVYLARHAAVPHLLRSGRGAIVTVSSRAAVDPAPHAAYAVAKAGVVTLTSVLAAELKPHGITANAVLPGIIDTPSNRVGATPEAIARWTKPEEIARVIIGQDGRAHSGLSADLLGLCPRPAEHDEQRRAFGLHLRVPCGRLHQSASVRRGAGQPEDQVPADLVVPGAHRPAAGRRELKGGQLPDPSYAA